LPFGGESPVNQTVLRASRSGCCSQLGPSHCTWCWHLHQSSAGCRDWVAVEIWRTNTEKSMT